MADGGGRGHGGLICFEGFCREKETSGVEGIGGAEGFWARRRGNGNGVSHSYVGRVLTSNGPEWRVHLSIGLSLCWKVLCLSGYVAQQLWIFFSPKDPGQVPGFN